MEIGVKTWLALVVGAGVLVAVQTLPPESIEVPNDDLPEQVRLAEALSDVRRAHGVLQMTRWADSLSAIVTAASAGSLTLSPPASGQLSPEGVTGWREAYQAELTSLARRDPEVRLGVFWLPVTQSAVPGVTLGPIGSAIFAGVRGGIPYCFETRPYASTGIRDVDLRAASLHGLGACRLYASYGPPGGGVGSWLDAGAWGFAMLAQPEEDWMSLRRDAPRIAMLREAPLFGTGRHPLAGASLPVQACLSGSAASCLRAVTEPALLASQFEDRAAVAAGSPLSFYEEDRGSLQPPFSYLDDSLLAEIEAQFGGDAFARFWSSDESVEVAFASAFGVDMGEWLLGWVDNATGIYRAGPSVPKSDFGLTILTLMALGMVATAAAARRQV